MRGQNGGYSQAEKRTECPGRADSWSVLGEERLGAGGLGSLEGHTGAEGLGVDHHSRAGAAG